MERLDLYTFFKSHKGKIVGILAGLLFGILVLAVGFWRSVFLTICISIGYVVGSVYDGGSRLRLFIRRIFSNDIQ